MNDGGRLKIRIHGRDVTADDAAGVVAATKRLLDAVTESVCGEAGAIQWRWTDLRWICDGCGRDRPYEHDDWVYVNGDDFCPGCAPRLGDAA